MTDEMPIIKKVKLKRELVDLALELNVFFPTIKINYGEAKIAKSLLEAQQNHHVGSEVTISKITHRVIDIDFKKYEMFIEILPGVMQNIIVGACDIEDDYAEIIGIPRVMYNTESDKSYYITTDLVILVKNT